LRVRGELGELSADDEFAEAFGAGGRPGRSPGRPALVTVLLNLIRLDARWNGHPLDRTRVSHLARLALPLQASGEHTLGHRHRSSERGSSAAPLPAAAG
jgi:hypothetical protein